MLRPPVLLSLLLSWLVAVALAPAAWAVSAVNPFGVNVRSSGPTTVFLTFQNLDPGEVALEAFWCGELQPALMAANPQLQLPVPVQTSNPCLPGTVYGRLPLALDRSRTSTSGAFTNLTDVMTIPSSVARRAYQDAQAGLNSAFFYVRRFAGPAGDRFVVVTCRMAGGGARVPLALMDVRLAFETAGTRPTVLALAPGQRPPRLSARIAYNGSGTLRGRWEVVLPGDPEPSDEDLLTAATLPVEQRLRQRRWTLVERFEVFLPPTGEFTLPGPDPARLPHELEGPYKLLLRVEASDDREGSSNTGGGRLAVAGGVAGFPMPVLRYVVGASVPGGERDAAFGRGPTLLLPAPDAGSEGTPTFAWADPAGAALLRMEVQAEDGGRWTEVLSALVRPGVGRYAAPPWWADAQRGKPLRWRVVVLDDSGRAASASEWRALKLP
ncbi:MAG: hypothetical protein KF683_20700 [Rubrivivax sp.]|nr:hypothetical protein [Rubrivivax sp.]